MMEAEEVDDVVPAGETVQTVEKVQAASEQITPNSSQREPNTTASDIQPQANAGLAAPSPTASSDRTQTALRDATSPNSYVNQGFGQETISDVTSGADAHSLPASPIASNTTPIYTPVTSNIDTSITATVAISNTGQSVQDVSSQMVSSSHSAAVSTPEAYVPASGLSRTEDPTLSNPNDDDDDFSRLAAVAEVAVEQLKQQPQSKSSTASPQRQSDFADVPLSPSVL